MYRSRLATVAFVLVTAGSPACTDWNAGSNIGIAVTHDPRAVADVDHTGLVWWETQGSSVAEVGPAQDAGAEDATTGSDDAVNVEILGPDASADDAADVVDSTNSDAAADGLTAPDGVLDDAVDACAGANRPIGCSCTISQQCASGFCVNGAGGPICSPGCKTVVCPSGWACEAPALVCKLMADANGSDAAAPDASPDAATTDVTAPDGGASDTQANDTAANDTAANDTAANDTAAQDTLAEDSAAGDVPDGSGPDATGADGVPAQDTALVDAQPADAAIADALSDASGDSATDAAQDVDTDGLTGLDWQGYPDASYPDDADVYGGAINSCLSLYLYQQETCGKNNPTAACIDGVANQGSLYANFLFEPVRACQDALCVDLCAMAIDETCMNQCIGKNCPNQFLSCVSNDEHGTAGCQATFSCSMAYPGKLLTIGAKCYANGTLAAQLQVGGLIACETKPNTDSCFQAIGDCYDQGAAATNTCMQTITCTQNCGGNQDCVWTCIGKATPSARKAVDALGDCMVTVCTPKCNGDQNCQNACLSSDCSTQFNACVSN